MCPSLFKVPYLSRQESFFTAQAIKYLRTLVNHRCNFQEFFTWIRFQNFSEYSKVFHFLLLQLCSQKTTRLIVHVQCWSVCKPVLTRCWWHLSQFPVWYCPVQYDICTDFRLLLYGAICIQLVQQCHWDTICTWLPPNQGLLFSIRENREKKDILKSHWKSVTL